MPVAKNKTVLKKKQVTEPLVTVYRDSALQLVAISSVSSCAHQDVASNPQRGVPCREIPRDVSWLILERATERATGTTNHEKHHWSHDSNQMDLEIQQRRQFASEGAF